MQISSTFPTQFLNNLTALYFYLLKFDESNAFSFRKEKKEINKRSSTLLNEES